MPITSISWWYLLTYLPCLFSGLFICACRSFLSTWLVYNWYCTVCMVLVLWMFIHFLFRFVSYVCSNILISSIVQLVLFVYPTAYMPHCACLAIIERCRSIINTRKLQTWFGYQDHIVSIPKTTQKPQDTNHQVFSRGKQESLHRNSFCNGSSCVTMCGLRWILICLIALIILICGLHNTFFRLLLLLLFF